VVRAAGRREDVADFFGGVFRAFRGVALDRFCPLRAGALPDPDLPVPDVLREDVLELRDPGGEDVRVAMPPT
jgi:hypothetical protein